MTPPPIIENRRSGNKLKAVLLFGVLMAATVWIGSELGSSRKDSASAIDESSLTQSASLADGGDAYEGAKPGDQSAVGSSGSSASSGQSYTPRIGKSMRFVRAEYSLVTTSGSKPATEGEVADVFVHVGSSGQKVQLRPNQGREYPRVYVREGETVSIRVEFPASEPGSKVAVVPQDGGSLAGSRSSLAHTLDAEQAIAFDFTAGRNRGTHRVKLLGQSGEVHLLDFWVGEENPFRTAAAK
jgi:hypothetical protein